MPFLVGNSEGAAAVEDQRAPPVWTEANVDERDMPSATYKISRCLKLLVKLFLNSR